MTLLLAWNLDKSLEKHRLLPLGNTRPAILLNDNDDFIVARKTINRKLAVLSGKLDGVAHVIEQDLRDFEAIAADALRYGIVFVVY